MNITIEQNDWRLVQQAINQVSEAGGGCVSVATFVTEAHTIFMKSNVRLHLENGCGIAGTADYHDYVDFRPDELGGLAPEKSNCTLVAGVNANNIAITGAGKLECPGVKFYDENSKCYGRFFAKPPTPRPRLLHLVNCNDVLLADSLYLNSPCWTIWLSGCQRVSIRGIRIEGDQRMINNDGIDIDSCRDVTVADCHIRTADDCLVLRAMPRNGQGTSVCENVTISNCVLDSACQGMRIGCPSDGVIRNCRITGLVLNCPGNGIVAVNPKRYLREGCNGAMELSNITVSNASISANGNPIRIEVEEGICLKGIRDIVFDNIVMNSPTPCVFIGSEETKPENITLRMSRWRQTAPCEDMLVIRKCRRFRLEGFEIEGLGQ